MSEPDTDMHESYDDPYPSEKYAWFVVGLLMIAYIFSFVDRQILSLLVGPIQEDMNLNDNHLALLGGFAFAIFYTVLGLPMGRLADSKSRRSLIAIGLAVWSFMTMGCGKATTFMQLFLLRMGVGVGESTLSPSAYSLITDFFRPQRMALAISVYGAGIYIGSGMAYLLGGIIVGMASGGESVELPLVGMVRPWQTVFFYIGIPGLLFVPFLFLIKEPKRRGLGAKADTGSVPVTEVASYVFKNWRTFLYHNVGFALLSLISYGSGFWIPTYFIRIHGMSGGDIGKIYGIIVIIFGTLGIISGGFLADRLKQKGYADARMRVGLQASLAHLPLGLLFPFMPNQLSAILVMCPAVFTAAMPFGVAPAAIQEMMPNRMRGQASAIYLFIVNLIGMGLGTQSISIFTENIFQDQMKIHWSLATVSTGFGVVGTFLLWRGMIRFRKLVEEREAAG